LAQFTYLETKATNQNDINDDIKKRLIWEINATTPFRIFNLSISSLDTLCFTYTGAEMVSHSEQRTKCWE
jgi:hypothetical protein